MNADTIARKLITLDGYAFGTDTQQAIDTMLDKGMICAEMRNGNWWRARRNGATKTWKTRAGHFRIPIKAGFRGTGYITHDNLRYFASCDDLDALGIKHT